jgi:hypothetical protein
MCLMVILGSPLVQLPTKAGMASTSSWDRPVHRALLYHHRKSTSRPPIGTLGQPHATAVGCVLMAFLACPRCASQMDAKSVVECNTCFLVPVYLSQWVHENVKHPAMMRFALGGMEARVQSAVVPYGIHTLTRATFVQAHTIRSPANMDATRASCRHMGCICVDVPME